MSRETPPASPGRILIADDEHLVAAGLSSCVSSLGCEVVGPASDGHEALQLAEHGADLALLDIRMPGCDGIDTAQTLWSKFGIPCIIVSAFSDEGYVRRAQETGIFGFLLKPVTIDTLRTAIAIAWSRAEATQGLQTRIDQLETTLANRKVIERAKWLLVNQEGMTEPEAHGHLQRTSRNARRPLVEVAQEVIDRAASDTPAGAR